MVPGAPGLATPKATIQLEQTLSQAFREPKEPIAWPDPGLEDTDALVVLHPAHEHGQRWLRASLYSTETGVALYSLTLPWDETTLDSFPGLFWLEAAPCFPKLRAPQEGCIALMIGPQEKAEESYDQDAVQTLRRLLAGMRHSFSQAPEIQLVHQDQWKKIDGEAIHAVPALWRGGIQFLGRLETPATEGEPWLFHWQLTDAEGKNPLEGQVAGRPDQFPQWLREISAELAKHLKVAEPSVPALEKKSRHYFEIAKLLVRNNNRVAALSALQLAALAVPDAELIELRFRAAHASPKNYPSASPELLREYLGIILQLSRDSLHFLREDRPPYPVMQWLDEIAFLRHARVQAVDGGFTLRAVRKIFKEEIPRFLRFAEQNKERDFYIIPGGQVADLCFLLGVPELIEEGMLATARELEVLHHSHNSLGIYRSLSIFPPSQDIKHSAPDVAAFRNGARRLRERPGSIARCLADLYELPLLTNGVEQTKLLRDAHEALWEITRNVNGEKGGLNVTAHLLNGFLYSRRGSDDGPDWRRAYLPTLLVNAYGGSYWTMQSKRWDCWSMEEELLSRDKPNAESAARLADYLLLKMVAKGHYGNLISSGNDRTPAPLIRQISKSMGANNQEWLKRWPAQQPPVLSSETRSMSLWSPYLQGKLDKDMSASIADYQWHGGSLFVTMNTQPEQSSTKKPVKALLYKIDPITLNTQVLDQAEGDWITKFRDFFPVSGEWGVLTHELSAPDPTKPTDTVQIKKLRIVSLKGGAAAHETDFPGADLAGRLAAGNELLAHYHLNKGDRITLTTARGEATTLAECARSPAQSPLDDAKYGKYHLLGRMGKSGEVLISAEIIRKMENANAWYILDTHYFAWHPGLKTWRPVEEKEGIALEKQWKFPDYGKLSWLDNQWQLTRTGQSRGLTLDLDATGLAELPPFARCSTQLPPRHSDGIIFPGSVTLILEPWTDKGEERSGLWIENSGPAK